MITHFQIIKHGTLTTDKGMITLGRGMGKQITIPVFCFLVKHAKGNVLIDTGFSADFAETWGKRLHFYQPQLVEDVVTALKDIRVDFIINTHLHIDHGENNALFPDAEIVVQKKEFETACKPSLYQKLAYPDSIDTKLRYRLLERNTDLFDDGSIKIIQTPGHTIGHQSVLLNLKGKKIFIAGDACYTAENLKYSCLPGILWNPDKIMEQYAFMRTLKDTSLIFGHEESNQV